MLAMLSQPSLQVGPVRSAPDTPASDLEPEASARAAGKEEVCSGKDSWHAGVYVGLGGSKLPGVLPEWREEPRLSSVDVALFSEVPRLSVEAKWPF